MPSEALLLIEVARSSLAKDLGIKPRIHAAAGVPEYWVVDLERRRTHVHTAAVDDTWTRVDPRTFDDTLDAAGVAVRMADLLPPGA